MKKAADVMKPGVALVAAVLLFIGCSTPERLTAAPALQHSRLDVAELDQMIAAHVRDKELVGLSVGVLYEGKVVLAKGYGLRSIETHEPVTSETMFAIASVSKQFACASALLLAEKGKLSLDDRVAKYFPNLTRAGDITLLDLGQHVSGYRDYYPLDFVDRQISRPRLVDDVIRDFATMQLDFEPRTRWSYSNTGYLILGRVVERVSGLEYGEFLRRRLFGPLRLAHTGYELDRQDPRVARGYTSYGFGKLEPAIAEGNGWIAAAGGVWSTPSDLLSWDLALMDRKILSKASYQVITTPRRLPDGRSTGYGCGQQVTENGPAMVLSHRGATSGFRAVNTLVPATRSAVVLMANRDFAVLTSLHDTILAKLLPAADAPAVRGPPVVDAARDFLTQLRSGRVDRAQLGEEFSTYLTDARISAAARTLAHSEASDFKIAEVTERGGMEASRVAFKLGDTPALAVMYRTHDGRIQQFLFFRQ